MVGKIPLSWQIKYIFNRTGAIDEHVIRGSGIGEDAAVIDIGNGFYLLTHTDPITETSSLVGRLAMQISSNDIAVKGIKPRWALVTLLLPDGFSETEIDLITTDIDSAAKELGISIVGGHTEETDEITRPIVSVTQIGISEGEHILNIDDSKPGDFIIMINEAGIEGTAIIAFEHSDGLYDMTEIIKSAKEFIKETSVLEIALLAARSGAKAMHDPTEGGVIGGLVEMALSSGNTFEVDRTRIPIRRETRLICERLKIDPLKLISSGTLIAIVRQDDVERFLGSFKGRAGIIGIVKEWNGEPLRMGVEVYKEPPIDELVRIPH